MFHDYSEHGVMVCHLSVCIYLLLSCLTLDISAFLCSHASL